MVIFEFIFPFLCLQRLVLRSVKICPLKAAALGLTVMPAEGNSDSGETGSPEV